MLAYAANQRRIGARGSSPNALLLIIGCHAILIAALISVRSGQEQRTRFPPTTIVSVPIEKPPPPVPAQPTHATKSVNTRDTHAPAPEPTTTEPREPWSSGPTFSSGPIAQPNPIPLPPLPPPVGITRDPQLLTPPSELRPPYPQSKLLAEEETTLTLRLTIDGQGKVVAVDPVGRADPVFLAAARRHLIAHWRYRPAMKDGRAVPSSIIINLRFELDG